MDVKYLKYILEIAKEKNISRAAKNLFISQPYLSLYLSKLEKEIGAPLFIRSRKGLEPTPEGQLYLETAEQVVRMKEELYQKIQRRAVKKKLYFGVTSQWGCRLYNEIRGPFEERYPEYSLEMSMLGTLALKDKLDEGKMPFAAVAAVDLNIWTPKPLLIRREEMILILPESHPYYQKRKDSWNGKITIEDFLRYFQDDTFLVDRKIITSQCAVDRFVKEIGFHPTKSYMVEGTFWTCSMVQQEAGITMMAVSASYQLPGIVLCHLEPELYRYNLVVQSKVYPIGEPEAYLYELIQQHFEMDDVKLAET